MTETATTVLNGVVNNGMLTGVLDEVLALLPVCIPVLIGFIAIRKGISFVRNILQSA